MSDVRRKRKERSHSTGRRRNKVYSIIMAILIALFSFVRYYIDLLIDLVFSYYYDPKRLFVPSPKNKLVLESATSLANKIRKREVTSEEVVSAFIERIRDINGVINAVVDDRFEEALIEARQIDKDIANGTIQDVDFQEKPFLGLPFTAKETTSVKGLSNTMGLLKRQDKKAKYDAECITLMKNSGAICIGVTNIPQLNYWQETSNPVYGITNNPYNSTRNVGGSSGGETSNMAACGSPLSIGTDIGGSIRLPSFMCGVFGHKPTSGLTSTKGLTFRDGKESQTMVVVGPISKYAEDLIPTLKILSDTSKLNLNTPVDVSQLRVFYVSDPQDPLVSPMHTDMKNAVWKTINYFREACSTPPETIELKQFRYTAKLWRYWMTQEETDFLEDLNDRQGKVNSISEIVKHFLWLSSDYTTGTIYNLINKHLPRVPEDWAKEETETLKKKLLEKLGDNGVLLYPSQPFTASYHHTALLRPFNFNYFSIFNVLKFPVTQVPLGLDSEGMPLGIQVVAAPYQDHLTIAVAKALEKEFGGWVPPFQDK